MVLYDSCDTDDLISKKVLTSFYHAMSVTWKITETTFDGYAKSNLIILNSRTAEMEEFLDTYIGPYENG